MFKLQVSTVGIITTTLLIVALGFGSNSARAEGAAHTINVINNCSADRDGDLIADPIHVGVVSIPSGRPSAVKLIPDNDPTKSPIDILTHGGWKMDKGDKAVLTVPSGWVSGNIWARTGCNFDLSNPELLCKTPTQNCCDTGGCIAVAQVTDPDNPSIIISPQKFGINCINTGVPPLTLAEFTLQDSDPTNPDIRDTYDISMVSGSNVAVKIEPDPKIYKIKKR